MWPKRCRLYAHLFRKKYGSLFSSRTWGEPSKSSREVIQNVKKVFDVSLGLHEQKKIHAFILTWASQICYSCSKTNKHIFFFHFFWTHNMLHNGRAAHRMTFLRLAISHQCYLQLPHNTRVNHRLSLLLLGISHKKRVTHICRITNFSPTWCRFYVWLSRINIV